MSASVILTGATPLAGAEMRRDSASRRQTNQPFLLSGGPRSPVSDTTCLSSLGAGSDHMDHVTTQLPYALTAAGLASGLYVALSVLMF